MRDPHRRLSRSVQEFLTSVGVPERGHLDDLPKRWEKFSDVALLQRSAFTHTRWDGLGQAGLWEAVAEGLSVSRLGRKGEVSGDFRESNAELLLGVDDVVERIENGCRFEYPFCSIMWSQGNFSERVRVTKLVERGDVVADLFSGQGYFTIPILVHTEAAHVHAFEWNPQGILALDRIWRSIRSVSAARSTWETLARPGQIVSREGPIGYCWASFRIHKEAMPQLSGC